jgi:hypothetical protein
MPYTYSSLYDYEIDYPPSGVATIPSGEALTGDDGSTALTADDGATALTTD